ncbi:MAG: DUF4214 domain-containing protein [Clostridiales bacterium]|nr:DUF4214 domain-containing protein [Clostridiales bacterium]
MKKTMRIATKITAIVVFIAIALLALPFAGRTALASETTATQKADDATKAYLSYLYDSATAFLSVNSNKLPADVNAALDCARANASPVLNSDNLDDCTTAITNLRIQLRVAESTLAGTPIDTNAAPDFITGTYGYVNANMAKLPVSSGTANTVASLYANNRNLSIPMIRTLVVNNFVERLYPQAFGRSFDVAGRDAYVNGIINGTYTGTDVITMMFTSPECTSRNLSNEAFVTALYRAFFDRDPDTAGRTNWVNALNNGMTRAELVQTFAATTDWADLCNFYMINA